MKEQSKIPTSKVKRAAKLIGTGAKVGGNYVKYFTNKAIGNKTFENNCRNYKITRELFTFNSK